MVLSDVMDDANSVRIGAAVTMKKFRTTSIYYVFFASSICLLWACFLSVSENQNTHTFLNTATVLIFYGGMLCTFKKLSISRVTGLVKAIFNKRNI